VSDRIAQFSSEPRAFVGEINPVAAFMPECSNQAALFKVGKVAALLFRDVKQGRSAPVASVVGKGSEECFGSRCHLFFSSRLVALSTPFR
jgi:hypothetical protein